MYDTESEKLEQKIAALEAENEALRLRESTLRALLDSVNDVIWLASGDGSRVDYGNAAIERIYGRPVEEFLANIDFWHEHVHPEDRERVLEEAKGLERDESVESVYRIVRPDGAIQWIRDRKGVVPNTGDGQRVFGGIAADITQQVMDTEALLASEERYRRLVEAASDGILVIEGSRFVFANRAAATMFRVESAELMVGRTFTDFVSPEYREMMVDRGQRRDRGEQVRRRYEFLGLRQDGTTFEAEINVSVVTFEGKLCRQGVLRDISERRQMEERLRHGEKMEAIGQLAGGIAHDFNNQLGGILGFTELLIENLQNPENRELSEEILAAANRSTHLVSQLLAFARKGQYQVEEVDLHELIEGVTSLLSRSLDKRISIRSELRAMPSTTLGDASQLQNALLNLALNARDAMKDGGVLSFATEVVELDDIDVDTLHLKPTTEGYVAVSVTDTGIGMHDGTRARMFEPFFTTKEPGEGTGMGLAGVYGTVRNHGGTLRVDSEPGRGTRIDLFFPIAATGHRSAPEVVKRSEPGGCGRILVVDDERMICDLLTRMLESMGHEVVCSGKPEEAIELFRASFMEFDLVILDMRMPGLNGRQTFVALKEIQPEVKAILMSGYSIDLEAQAALEDGMLGFLAKPFRKESLALIVRESLGR